MKTTWKQIKSACEIPQGSAVVLKFRINVSDALAAIGYGHRVEF